MAFRFRRRVRLMSGVHLNFGKTGMSLTAGVRGASITAGPRGVYSNTGLVGTGMSWRQRLDTGGSSPGPTEQEGRDVRVVLDLEEDGGVRILLQDGTAPGAALLRRLREQHKETIAEWLAGNVERVNADYEACVNVHLGTPSPSAPRWPPFPVFMEPEPQAPAAPRISLLDRLLLRRTRLERAHLQEMLEHTRAVARWQERATAHDAEIRDIQAALAGVGEGEAAAAEKVLGIILESLPWPRETNICFDFADDIATLSLDIDLPELDEMPTRVASLARGGARISYRERTDAQLRRDYGRFTHGIVFRVVGECFANIVHLDEIGLSAFTQRVDPATGHVRDTYILSLRVTRTQWAAINWRNLGDLDPTEALAAFNLLRSRDRSGTLREITPHP